MPAFGVSTTSTSGSLFGRGTAISAGTGFGSGGLGSTNTPSTGFRSGNTGGLLGQNRPASFGFGTTGTSGGFFSSGNTSGTTGSAFGTGGAPAFGGGLNLSANNGTACTPFQAHVEKDGATNQNAHYQSITFQQPYQGFSLEELRLQDYAQGRRYGNADGQAGALGASAGFGLIGSNSTNARGFTSNASTCGGLFGPNNNNTLTPFGGGQNNTTGGFSGNTSGRLFGPKPATGGGLFGSNNTATSGQPTDGPFGISGGGTGSAFGSGNTGVFGGNTTGGLLGSNNQQNQNKPFNGGFGSGMSTRFGGLKTGTGFAANSNTSIGGGLFGGNTDNTASAFGGNKQQQNDTSNLFRGFGQNNRQNQTQLMGGGPFGGGFGQGNNQQQQQAKPLFGASTGGTGNGLFGNNQQQPNQTGGILFGSNQQQNQTSGSIFGNRPAGMTSGLFGGGLGQNQNNQQKQAAVGFFGAKPADTAGGLFGGGTKANTNVGGGLFGGSLGLKNTSFTGPPGGLFDNNQQQNQPQQQTTLGGSLLSASTVQHSVNQVPQVTASTNGSPYGNEHLFASLSIPSQNIGPLATPLSHSQKQKKAILHRHRINPTASLRLITPQKRLNGYGFSYSSNGTLGSTMGTGSLSFSGSRVGGRTSFSKSLPKSSYTGNLRNTWNAEDSIMSPDVFTPSKRPTYADVGSMKKLNIDRALNIRPSLFSNANNQSPASPKKRISFNASTTLNCSLDGTNGPLVLSDRKWATPSAEEQGFLRSLKNRERQTDDVTANEDKPETKGNELKIVAEDSSQDTANTRKVANEKPCKGQKDQIPGEYWSEPSLDQLKKMSKQELKSLEDFRVGRKGIGEIQFEHPVNLTGIKLDDLLGKVIQLNVRNALVYPSETSTPPMGKGLNVPSLILLENSWPRAQAGRLPGHENNDPHFQKHIERLKNVEGTEFVDYDAKTGTWKFRVQHYTIYGLDYDDESAYSLPLICNRPTRRCGKHRILRAFVSCISESLYHCQPFRAVLTL